ncbi:sigma-70 family RNA polymerase sigma factor [Celeribacter sp.]|uniref:sigma-70 family RNA polymerase sigma factor n=1 Tax=Celeribacter sp. TaxID=1890673 RepID=UPI003A952C16
MTTVADIETYILRTGLGDRAAFSSLYSATSAKLFGVCLRVLNNRAEAEDALQDVFIRIWQKADRYAVNGYSPMTWLITLARNLAIDRLRARKAPAKPIEDMVDLAHSGPTPEEAVVQSGQDAQINRCLDALDTRHAASVRGAYLEGASYQDLADRAGVPINTMRTWLRRSLAKLKDCMSQ